MGDLTKRLAASIAIAAVLYVSGSMFVYGLAHPEMTQAQVLLNTWAALTWWW